VPRTTNPVDEIETDAVAVGKLARVVETLAIDRATEALLAVEKALHGHAAERKAACAVMDAVLQQATATAAAFDAMRVEVAKLRETVADLAALRTAGSRDGRPDQLLAKEQGNCEARGVTIPTER
jgi:hypothetical protein